MKELQFDTMKKIWLLTMCLLMLFGCTKTVNKYNISQQDIINVTIADYDDYEIQLNKEDYTRIITAFNSIENISLNEEFTDNAVYGKPIYVMEREYVNTNVAIEISELGYIGLWKDNDTYGTYYNVDIFEDFHDVFREIIDKNGMEINDMKGLTSNDSFVKLPFSNDDIYLVGCEMNVDELLNIVNVENTIEDNLSIKDYLNRYMNNPKCNDEIVIDNVLFKLLGVEEEEIITVYVKVINE